MQHWSEIVGGHARYSFKAVLLTIATTESKRGIPQGSAAKAGLHSLDVHSSKARQTQCATCYGRKVDNSPSHERSAVGHPTCDRFFANAYSKR